MASKKKVNKKIGASVIVALLISCILFVGCAPQIKSPASTNLPASSVPSQVATNTIITSVTLSPSNTPSPTNTKIVWTPLPNEASVLATLPGITSVVNQNPGNIDISGGVQVSFIDVGQGDAILIRSPEGLYGLIDGGEKGSGIKQYLQSQGVESLDLMVATHPHSDHIGGLVEVLGIIPTTRVVTNGEAHTTAIYENFLDAIISSEAEYIEVSRGDTLHLGSLLLDVLNPGSLADDDINRNSLVLRMVFGKTTFLFMGDASSDAEAEMGAAGMALHADVLKVGHHGSSTSTSAVFLAAVQPAIAVYSAGLGNSYGHPDPSTMSALNGSGAQVYGTDVNGTVIVSVDGNGYSLGSGVHAQENPPPVVIPIIEPTPTTSGVQAGSGDVTISVSSLTSPISAGGTARLTIQTAPGANCTITVYYKSGASEAAGLGPQVADGSGQATWSWKVGSRTTKGTWKIVVTSHQGGKSSTQEIPFEVQ